MSALKERQTQCSQSAAHLAYIWVGVEILVRIGIWAGFVWFKKVEIVAAWIFGAAFGLIALEFHVLQITLAAMDEMQEYIDKRIEEGDSQRLDEVD